MKGEKIMEFCGWLCGECCEKYGWTEDRVPPKEQYVSCENCLKVHQHFEKSKEVTS